MAIGLPGTKGGPGGPNCGVGAAVRGGFSAAHDGIPAVSNASPMIHARFIPASLPYAPSFGDGRRNQNWA
jgi:hypothetical protein